MSRSFFVLFFVVACGGKSTTVQDNAVPPIGSDMPPPASSQPPPPPPVDASSPPSMDAGFATSACGDPGTGLAGTPYDISRSHFAFGSAPAQQILNGTTRWTGIDGVVSIGAFGYAMGSMNSGAPETALPDWSADPVALTAHVRDYWGAMGIPTCQIQGTQVTAMGGSGGFRRTVFVNRSLDAIPIVDSKAYASIDNADQSTVEGFLWPAIPPTVVTSARAFRAQIADPAGLAAYKAKLPTAAQGDGTLLIHHSAVALMPIPPFKAAATWDVTFGSDTHSYDANGVEVIEQW